MLLPLVLFVLLAPFVTYLGFPDRDDKYMLMDWQRLAQMVCVCLSLATYCWCERSKFHFVVRLPLMQVSGWALFFLLGAISASFALYPRFAWIELSWLLACISVIVAGSLSTKHAGPDLIGLIRFCVITAFASYTPLYFIANSDFHFELSTIFGPYFVGYSNVRVFSDVQSALICLIPWVLKTTNMSSRLRLAAYSVAGCYVALAFVSGSRSVILGQSVAIIAAAILLHRKDSMHYIKGAINLWLIGGLTYVLLFVIIPFLNRVLTIESPAMPTQLSTHSFSRTTSSGRFELWEHAWKLGMENPWIGVGPMHFAIPGASQAASPHNHLLQLFSEYGFLASVLFIALSITWLQKVLRGIERSRYQYDEPERQLSVAIFCAIIALLAQSLVSPVFNNPQTQVILILLIVALGPLTQRPPQEEQIRVKQKTVAFVVASAVVAAIATAFPWVTTLAERNACYSMSRTKPTPDLAPRFWQQGWLFAPCEPVLQ